LSAELWPCCIGIGGPVELFFRWLKCILGQRHWLAESPRGVTIQLYLALIAALLLATLQRVPTHQAHDGVVAVLSAGLGHGRGLVAALHRSAASANDSALRRFAKAHIVGPGFVLNRLIAAMAAPLSTNPSNPPTTSSPHAGSMPNTLALRLPVVH